MKKKKKMTNTKAWISILLILVVLAGCVFTVAEGLGKQHKGKADHIKLGLDLAGGVSITYEVSEKSPSDKDMSDTIYKLQKRVESFSTESEVYREGKNRITVEIPGATDANKVLETLGKPGNLVFRTEDGKEVLTGSNIQSADAQTTEQNGIKGYVVALSMDREGTTAFAEATKENINKRIYIVYDNEVVSAPTVNSVISDGQCVIEGMESFESAENLATTIRIGALPLTLKELRSNVVGAKLGDNAVKTSLMAGGIGILLIWLLMIVLYRFPGFLSGFSLLGYVVLNFLAINGFDVTMTLPGIAGMLLAIGMAVDANVIIFTRIKEEIANGRSVADAIDLGHNKALSAILDGNITTIIASVILYWKGSGTVKGFAQTLGIGVLLSMFMALVITKLLVQIFYTLGVKDEKMYGRQKPAKTIDYIGLCKFTVPVAVLCIVVGLVFLPVNKSKTGNILNYDLEFSGGTAITMTMQETPTKEIQDSIKSEISKEVDGSIQVQKVTGMNKVVIKTKELPVAKRKVIEGQLKNKFKVTNYETEEIAGSVSTEMRNDAIVAVLISIIFMLLYIAFRFKDIRFGGSAVIALLHDVLVVFSVYSVARLSVGNTFIACMLTILGYSINATIVIFDRIRENNRKRADLRDVVNQSISQTLSRSVNTTITSFIPICLLFFMGVSTIKEFTFTLMCGILAGFFSSVCLTGPTYWFICTRDHRLSKI